MIVAPGTTGLSLIVQIVDDTGLGVTALTAATFPSVYIERAGETAVAVTLSDLAAENSAWSSGGVKESASGGGYYRIDAPNALAATANQCAKLVGEASGKHLICPVVQVENAPANVTAWAGDAVAVDANGVPEVSLAAVQPNYAPAKAGAQMDLVNAPNVTAVAAIQSGLATSAALSAVQDLVQCDQVVDISNNAQWVLVAIKKGTGVLGVGTELWRKNLKDQSGNPIVNTTTVICQAIQ